MRRREFIGIAGGAAAWPLAARAQQKAMPVIGFLNPTSALSPPGPFVVAFHKGLSETGYVEGQNLAVEYRWADGHYDRLPALAADLVGRKVDVIVVAGQISALAAKSATSTIPIVFVGVGDPAGIGLVASLARPGGNLTGFSNTAAELQPKRFELLSELVHQATVIALLVNPTNVAGERSERTTREIAEAARAKGVQLPILKASSESEIDAAFAALAGLHAGALFVGGDPFFNSRREQLVALASRHAIPAIYLWREFAVVVPSRTTVAADGKERRCSPLNRANAGSEGWGMFGDPAGEPHAMANESSDFPRHVAEDECAFFAVREGHLASTAHRRVAGCDRYSSAAIRTKQCRCDGPRMVQWIVRTRAS